MIETIEEPDYATSVCPFCGDRVAHYKDNPVIFCCNTEFKNPHLKKDKSISEEGACTDIWN